MATIATTVTIIICHFTFLNVISFFNFILLLLSKIGIFFNCLSDLCHDLYKISNFIPLLYIFRCLLTIKILDPWNWYPVANLKFNDSFLGFLDIVPASYMYISEIPDKRCLLPQSQLYRLFFHCKNHCI